MSTGDKKEFILTNSISVICGTKSFLGDTMI